MTEKIAPSSKISGLDLRYIGSPAIVGAAYSAFMATFAVIHYLLTTQYFSYVFGGQSLLSYTTGTVTNLDIFGPAAIFVVITRFMIVFGLTWLPLSYIAGIRRK